MDSMNAKRKGTRNEHKSIRILENAGYACTRAAASLGRFDIVGVSSTDVVLVQVKTNGNPRPAEREALQLFQAPVNCRKLLHVWHDHKRTPVVTLIP
jgi:hypothetical protein